MEIRVVLDLPGLTMKKIFDVPKELVPRKDDGVKFWEEKRKDAVMLGYATAFSVTRDLTQEDKPPIEVFLKPESDDLTKACLEEFERVLSKQGWQIQR